MGQCVSCLAETEFSYEYYCGEFDGNKRSTVGVRSRFIPTFKNICYRRDFACTPCIKSYLKAKSLRYRRETLLPKGRAAVTSGIFAGAAAAAATLAVVIAVMSNVSGMGFWAIISGATAVSIGGAVVFAASFRAYARAKSKYISTSEYNAILPDDERVDDETGARFVIKIAAENESADGFTFFTPSEKINVNWKLESGR
ncbi:MAG: hypothetical protein LBK41_08015 [Clostridiales bacterium]|jgi:hypothetical protein|nr:hypothetical protein [Clostridiales bacterium]